MKKSTLTGTMTVSALILTVALLSACGSSTSANAPKAPVDLAALTMTVYKSPSCGCCKEWVDYMQTEGFSVTAVDTDEVDAIKAQHGLTQPELKSCHTAVVDGYVIEGHVPASDVRRLLTERPDVVGLTAPGMPMMSPGMGSLVPKDYDVLVFNKGGEARVWSSY